MADIFDPRGDYHYKLIVPMLCAGTCTKDYVVSMDSSGDVTNAATATLWAACGVAQKSGVAGDVIPVQIAGYAKLTSDGNVAATDLVLHVINGGTVSGGTEAELATDPTLAYHVVAKNLVAADSGTTIYGWLVLGSAASA
jgi:hypothetical protein